MDQEERRNVIDARRDEADMRIVKEIGINVKKCPR